MIFGNYGRDDVFGINTYNLDTTIDYNSSKQNKNVIVKPAYMVSNDLSKYVVYFL